MKGIYLILAGLLVLVVAVAGCVAKEPVQAPAVEPTTQPQQSAAAEGDTLVPDAQGVQIESPLASDNETVDLGSLI